MNRIIKKFFLIVIFCLILIPAGFVLAGYNDLIAPGDSVTIGEFVYDDDMQPTTTACTIDIYFPDRTVAYSGSMDVSSTGWHYYTISSVDVPGTWPAVMTCGSVVTGDLAHLDKSFKVGYAPVSTTPIATAVSNAVWENATRTLTDMSTGSVATAVWEKEARTLTDYSTTSIAQSVWGITGRTLSGFGDLVANIWDSATADFTKVGSFGKRLGDLSFVNIAGAVWGNTYNTVRQLTDSALDSLSGGSLATESNITNASSSLASLISGISLDTTGLATSASIVTLSEQLTAASTSLALTIPSSINAYTSSTVNNASSSLLALLSGLMTSNTDIVTSTINNAIASASSSLSIQIDNASSSLSSQIAFASSTLYSTLNASILSSSSSFASLIGAISLDTSGLATSASIVTLSEQLTSASTSLAINIPSSISVTINNVSSSLASLITATGDTLGGKIDNASSSLSGQTEINGSLGSWNVAMSNVDRVLIGQKYKAKVYVTNYKSVPTNSSIVPKISLYNNNGNLVTENISMTLGTSTGSYSYNYTIPDLSEGLWEAEVKTEVESGKIIITNDYFAIEGSPAEVRVNTVSDAVAVSGGLEVTANIKITNEGNADYEYHYEWCTVSNVNDICRGGHDLFYGSNSKLIEVGSSTVENLTATVPSAGNYYFKLVVYYGMEKSGASRYFTATTPVVPATCGNGSCSGSETCSTCPADCGACSPGGGGGGGGGSPPPVIVATSTPATCDGADFNHDKKVNSIDFSILLAFWKTIWPFKNSCVDINKDKQVNSVDFSILMYQWGNKIL